MLAWQFQHWEAGGYKLESSLGYEASLWRWRVGTRYGVTEEDQVSSSFRPSSSPMYELWAIMHYMRPCLNKAKKRTETRVSSGKDCLAILRNLPWPRLLWRLQSGCLWTVRKDLDAGKPTPSDFEGCVGIQTSMTSFLQEPECSSPLSQSKTPRRSRMGNWT